MKSLQRGILIFVIAFAGYTSAQTTVCSGDSVVLVLNGYKQGSTLWQQSSDLITWSNASGKSYNDSLVITATNSLYYRAIVTDGTCSPFYSYEVLITVRPVPPIAKPASGITLLSFDANWAASEGATTYYLDVATDNGFTSFVNGFNNLNVNDKISTVAGVACNKTYYYRVRAYDDSCGKPSGNSNMITVTTPACPVYCTYKSACNGNITDSRDQKTYNTVQIGSQCWMAENLNVGKRIDGNLPQTPGADNQNADIEKYCYDDNFLNCNTYGGLYLWNEMMGYDTSRINAPGPRGICPTGWHLPTENEWKCLEMNLGMSQYEADKIGIRGTTEGGKLKDVVSALWHDPNTGATNTSGFTALPGGVRIIAPTFEAIGDVGCWWAATQSDTASAWYRQLINNETGVFRYYSPLSRYFLQYGNKAWAGMSARCVKDSL